MKKIALVFLLAATCGLAYAQQGPAEPDGECNLPKEAAVAPAPAAQPKAALTPKEQQKRFEKRNKEIKKLAKQYRKAKSDDKKAEIKARLLVIVSQATDESIAWGKERIAAVRANLDQWEKTILEQEKNLDQVKAKRVDDILSGEAERRYKLAQKRWKQEMKDRKKQMD